MSYVWEGSEYACGKETENIVILKLQTLPGKGKNVCTFYIYWTK